MTAAQNFLADEMADKARRLIALGNEMLAKAIELGARGSAAEVKQAGDPPDLSEFQGRTPGAKAKALYDGRRIRESLMPAHLFGEPGWDILLDLYMATLQGKQLPVTAVCVGSQAPNTTALRYIRLIEESGLLERGSDPADHRLHLLRLSPLAVELMTTVFELSEKVEMSEPKKQPALRLASSIGKSKPL